MKNIITMATMLIICTVLSTLCLSCYNSTVAMATQITDLNCQISNSETIINQQSTTMKNLERELQVQKHTMEANNQEVVETMEQEFKQKLASVSLEGASTGMIDSDGYLLETFETLNGYCQENKFAFHEAYMGQKISITGVLERINNNGTTLILGSTKNYLTMVCSTAKNKLYDTKLSINVGDIITIQGTIISTNEVCTINVDSIAVE